MKKTDEKYVVRPAVSLLINSSKAGSIVNSLDISALISPKNGFKISSNWAWKIQARTAEITYNENIKQIRRLLSAMELLTSLLAIEKYLFILWYLFGGVNVVLVHQHITKPAYDR